MIRIVDYAYIFLTVAFTVYGQLVIKWRITKLAPAPEDTLTKFKFLFALIFDPVIFSGFFAAFLASITWMLAMTKFDLSYAYPFMSLNFVFVLLMSQFVLSEPISLSKVVGVCLIVLGTFVVAKG